MLSFMGQAEWMIIIFAFIIIFLIKKGADPKARGVTEGNNNNELKQLPDTCPHCKNPINKKIRLCEWCGNQIV